MNPAQGLDRNLILITGKGGVGKTTIAEGLALALSRKNKNVLYVTFEDPNYALGARERRSSNLTHLNGTAQYAFEEYIGLKIGMTGFAKLFLQNKLIQFLSKIAPGLHDLVLLGQVWFERENFDHIVVDMPSTGYTISMFHSISNYARLFRGGPIHRDAEAMLETFADPEKCVFSIVALPEEMPLRESLELDEKLRGYFPKTTPRFLVNRLFPECAAPQHENPTEYRDPLARTASEYLERRAVLEKTNLRIFDDARIAYAKIPFISLNANTPKNRLIDRVSECFST